MTNDRTSEIKGQELEFTNLRYKVGFAKGIYLSKGGFTKIFTECLDVVYTITSSPRYFQRDSLMRFPNAIFIKQFRMIILAVTYNNINYFKFQKNVIVKKLVILCITGELIINT